MKTGIFNALLARAAKTRASPFLCLPVELRLVIYRRLLTTKRLLPAWPISGRSPFKLSDKDRKQERKALAAIEVQLLYVCKQIYFEARPILYGENRIWFRLHGPETHHLMDRWTSSLRPSTFANLSKVRLDLVQAIKVPCASAGVVRRRVLKDWSWSTDPTILHCPDCLRPVHKIDTCLYGGATFMGLDLQKRKVAWCPSIATTIIDTVCCEDDLCVIRGRKLARINPHALWPFNESLQAGESTEMLFEVPRSYESSYGTDGRPLEMTPPFHKGEQPPPTLQEFRRIMACLLSPLAVPHWEQDCGRIPHVCMRAVLPDDVWWGRWLKKSMNVVLGTEWRKRRMEEKGENDETKVCLPWTPEVDVLPPVMED